MTTNAEDWSTQTSYFRKESEVPDLPPLCSVSYFNNLKLTSTVNWMERLNGFFYRTNDSDDNNTTAAYTLYVCGWM